MWLPFKNILLVHEQDEDIDDEYFEYLKSQKIYIVTMQGVAVNNHFSFNVSPRHFTPILFEKYTPSLREWSEAYMLLMKINDRINYMQPCDTPKCIANFSPIHLDDAVNFDHIMWPMDNHVLQCVILNSVKYVVIGKSCPMFMVARALVCGCRLFVHEWWYGGEYQVYFEYNNVRYWSSRDDLLVQLANSSDIVSTPYNVVWDLRSLYTEDYVYDFFRDRFAALDIHDWYPQKIISEWSDIQLRMCEPHHISLDTLKILNT